MRRVRADEDLDMIFLVFCWGSRSCLLASLVFTTSLRMWDSLAELTPKWGPSNPMSHWTVCFFFFCFPPASTPLKVLTFEFFQPVQIRHQFTVDHHYDVAASASISLTLSYHPSLSSIVSGRSSRLHPESTQSCCM